MDAVGHADLPGGEQDLSRTCLRPVDALSATSPAPGSGDGYAS